MLKKITALMLAAFCYDQFPLLPSGHFHLIGRNVFRPRRPKQSRQKLQLLSQKKNIELLPYSDTRLITSEEATALSDQELRIARCEITARHGKRVCSEKTKSILKPSAGIILPTTTTALLCQTLKRRTWKLCIKRNWNVSRLPKKVLFLTMILQENGSVSMRIRKAIMLPKTPHS